MSIGVFMLLASVCRLASSRHKSHAKFSGLGKTGVLSASGWVEESPFSLKGSAQVRANLSLSLKRFLFHTCIATLPVGCFWEFLHFLNIFFYPLQIDIWSIIDTEHSLFKSIANFIIYICVCVWVCVCVQMLRSVGNLYFFLLVDSFHIWRFTRRWKKLIFTSRV